MLSQVSRLLRLKFIWYSKTMNLSNTIASLLAAVSGLLATAATIFSQASLRHRMMKTASWAHEQTSSIDEQNDYLVNMQRWAQSEVVAATIVPPKAFFGRFFIV